ncbi:lytic transglycosylase domain-containing protein [Psychrobium sp. 1_MG-2023]|uniref:lytic murein transglycosylase n=1 Tax=Psychrobium sp. 1_MG-2023 TaxID=3062624 RepID=UPI000C32F65B|nr:lytic murein transglycosylase [Psychrobium sp. 1_MG-2023]MDP2559605.1 lytic murein transglycosylase [Psychrobium sp. 1_MG-2023]PKF59439.1 lytic murein transglycosylase [Alteromonadales bacterium alter-6D02]
MKFLKRVTTSVMAISLCGLTSMAQAEQQPFEQWLEELRVEAREKGIDETVISTALTGITPYPKAIKNDRAQPEFKRTFVNYSKKRLSDWRVNTGLKMQKQHAELLEKVGKAYGVQPRFILSFWGLETNYGNYMGKNDVIRSLATLAYDKRRASYFRKELFNALRILEQGHIKLEDMKGSWSGAMGQGQFMPSSFLRFAQDFDGDGKKDIWNNHADVFASIAFYLKHFGWSDQQTWGRQVTLPDNASSWLAQVKADKPEKGCRALRSHTAKLPLSKWNELGIRRLNTQELPQVNMTATLITPDGVNGPAFLTYNNYRTILRYNCANSYAITIGLLADKFKS